MPLEIEFDVEGPARTERALTLGLFLPVAGQAGPGAGAVQQFFVRTRDNVAGIDIGGKAKTVPCDLKPVNRIRVQLADGRAVLFVNDRFCLDRSDKDFHPLLAFDMGCHSYLWPGMLVRVSNVRFRRWEPPKEESASKETSREKVQPDEKGEAKK